MSTLSKFSWSQVFSNNNGKTSGSGIAGLATIAVGLLCFMAGVSLYFFIGKDAGGYDIILQSLGLVTIGGGLLGIRKLSRGGNIPIDEDGIRDERKNTTINSTVVTNTHTAPVNKIATNTVESTQIIKESSEGAAIEIK